MKSSKEIFQCNCCGHIHKVDDKYKPRGDDVYEDLWCPKCHGYTRQLHCGNDMDEIYALYDVNIDENYYKY